MLTLVMYSILKYLGFKRSTRSSKNYYPSKTKQQYNQVILISDYCDPLECKLDIKDSLSKNINDGNHSVNLNEPYDWDCLYDDPLLFYDNYDWNYPLEENEYQIDLLDKNKSFISPNYNNNNNQQYLYNINKNDSPPELPKKRSTIRINDNIPINCGIKYNVNKTSNNYYKQNIASELPKRIKGNNIYQIPCSSSSASSSSSFSLSDNIIGDRSCHDWNDIDDFFTDKIELLKIQNSSRSEKISIKDSIDNSNENKIKKEDNRQLAIQVKSKIVNNTSHKEENSNKSSIDNEKRKLMSECPPLPERNYKQKKILNNIDSQDTSLLISSSLPPPTSSSSSSASSSSSSSLFSLNKKLPLLSNNNCSLEKCSIVDSISSLCPPLPERNYKLKKSNSQDMAVINKWRSGAQLYETAFDSKILKNNSKENDNNLITLKANDIHKNNKIIGHKDFDLALSARGNSEISTGKGSEYSTDVGSRSSSSGSSSNYSTRDNNNHEVIYDSPCEIPRRGIRASFHIPRSKSTDMGLGSLSSNGIGLGMIMRNKSKMGASCCSGIRAGISDLQSPCNDSRPLDDYDTPWDNGWNKVVQMMGVKEDNLVKDIPIKSKSDNRWNKMIQLMGVRKEKENSLLIKDVKREKEASSNKYFKKDSRKEFRSTKDLREIPARNLNYKDIKDTIKESVVLNNHHYQDHQSNHEKIKENKTIRNLPLKDIKNECESKESDLPETNLKENIPDIVDRPTRRLSNEQNVGISKLDLTLDLNDNVCQRNQRKKPVMTFSSYTPSVYEHVDTDIPLQKQGWYHGSITRLDAENLLRSMKEGSYLIRNCESTKRDYSLSLKSVKGFMHMKIVCTEDGKYVLGVFSKPFANIPEMIRHYTINKLPIRGAEHMSLLYPVIDQLL